MQIGVKPCEQVFRRRLCAYRAGENSTFAKSRVDRFQSSPVTLQKSALLLGRKGEHGVVHAQRSSDLRSDQLRIWNTGALCQSVAEQANPHAVRVGRFRGAVPREEVVQRDAIVVRKRVARILRHKIVGSAGKPRAMGREVEQGDLCFMRPVGEVGEKNRAQRFVETHFSLHRKLREREPGEGFRDRADFEHRVQGSPLPKKA
jgi:hypothetical protein